MIWKWIESHGYFPETINERAARLVALLVALLSLAAIVWSAPWISLLLAGGFFLRSAWGPRFDPLAKAALWIAPRITRERIVAGPPKRFAQIMGLVVSLCATAMWLLGYSDLSLGILGVLFIFASAESLAGFCVGCRIFRWMMLRGWIPQEVCERCFQLPNAPSSTQHRI